MKYLLIIAALSFASCNKSEHIENIDLVNGVYEVFDPAYSLIGGNADVSLYHIFQPPHTFRRLSFNAGHNFGDTNAKPRADSLHSYYKIENKLLMLPNQSPNPVNVIPGMEIIDQRDSEIYFKRYMVLRRSAIDASVLEDRTDTIVYKKVEDNARLNYFKKYTRQ